MQSILIIAGEVSGDLLGAGLVREFAAIKPEVKFFGFGGDRMASTGVELVYHVKQLAIFGIWEAVKNYRYIKNIQRQLLKVVKERKPSMAILIDYPGFNLNLAPKLKAMGISVFYYVSPQIWAWGAGRIRKIKKNVDLMAVLFDFEKGIYDRAGIPAVWVGHPMIDDIVITNRESVFREKNNLKDKDIVIGLFPGSRQSEVNRLLPSMLQAIPLIQRRFPAIKPIIAKADSLDESLYRAIFDRVRLFAPFNRSTNYELMAYSKLCLVCSGTATLECGVIGTPLLILYKTSFLTYIIARWLIKIRHIGLVNIISRRSVAPELIQRSCNPDNIALHTLMFLENSAKYQTAKTEMANLRNHIGKTGASRNVAAAAVELYNCIHKL